MKILMIGWEYPPLISGGLATATEGLINGLIELGHKVTLVLPHFPYRLKREGLTIVSPENPPELLLQYQPEAQLESRTLSEVLVGKVIQETLERIENASRVFSALPLSDPLASHYSYASCNEFSEEMTPEQRVIVARTLADFAQKIDNTTFESRIPVFTTVQEQSMSISILAERCLSTATFDVVHAHDWMCFSALEALRGKTDIPFIAHIHSTEIDRGGIHGNRKIQDLEKRGMEVAHRIITVSEYAKAVIVKHYNIHPQRIDVVYNAANAGHTTSEIESEIDVSVNSRPALNQTKPLWAPTVIFVGRVTFQKGPAYFVQAAETVLQSMPEVQFRVVGTGDLLPTMKQLVWELELEKSFHFEGFLDAKGVQQALLQSDLFVMPSVSEPFGIVALEAVQSKIPVIISKQAGVSEVLKHALKVDFWDTDLLADRILSLLRYASIRRELVQNAQIDLKNNTWKNAAGRCYAIYSQALVATSLSSVQS